MDSAPEPPIADATIRQRIVAMPVGAGIAVAGIAVAAALGALYVAPESEKVPTRPTAHILVVQNPPSLSIVWQFAGGHLSELAANQQRDIRFRSMDIGTDLQATKEGIRAELSGAPTSLIYTMGIMATRAAKEVTEEDALDIPVVFAVVSDPVGSGLVKSLSNSGNNLTGVTPTNELVASKRLEFLMEMLPRTERIVYAWNDEKTSGVTGLRTVAPSLGLELAERRVASVEDMVAHLSEFEYRKGDVILRASDAIGGGSLQRIIDLARTRGVPLVGTNAADTEKGALMSYGADYPSIGVQSARLVERVLSGVAPSDIPIEEASTFDLSVNATTAEALGIEVPQSFLLNVRHVYR